MRTQEKTKNVLVHSGVRDATGFCKRSKDPALGWKMGKQSPMATLAFAVGFMAATLLGASKLVASHEAIDQKLLQAQEVVRQFEEGNSRVRVIVNLVPPKTTAAALSLQDRSSAERRRNRIHARQSAVLNLVTKTEFELRSRFENQAGFSGCVTPVGFAQLLSDPNVVSIKPARVLTKFTKQGISLMNASTCRQMYSGQGVAIAIVDDGIDYTHPKLGGGGFPNSKVIGGCDIGDNDSDPFPMRSSLDTEWHGTWCAGIAAGNLGSEGDYVGGLAHDAKLYALKVSELDWLTGEPVIYNDTVIDAIDWCVTHRDDDPSHPILVISLSLGYGEYSSPYDDGFPGSFSQAVHNAVEAGITVVAASGNDGYCHAMAKPACIGDVISVGAVYDADIGRHPKFGYVGCISANSCAGYDCVECSDLYAPRKCYVDYTTGPDQVPTYSNSASFLDLLAPATVAYATDVAGSKGGSLGDYVGHGGTSAACPYSAGAIACLQSAAKHQTGSFLSPERIREILMSTGMPVIDSKSGVETPRIDLEKAIDEIDGPMGPPDPYLGCDAPSEQCHTVCWESTGATEQYSSTDTRLSIPDPGTTVSELTVDAAGVIQDLEVKLDIDHWRVSDLDVFLAAPDGTRVELFTDVGGAGVDFDGTVLNDEAQVSIRDGMAPFNGSYRPEGLLADFAGKDIEGTWRLAVTDDLSWKSGTLNTWSLVVDLIGATADVAYYAECATDKQFTNIVASSGWTLENSHTFEGLNSSRIYWYRVKALPLRGWHQTTQSDFQKNALQDVRVTHNGDVMLAGSETTGPESTAIENSSYESTAFWTVHGNDPVGIASFRSGNWASEGSYSFGTCFWRSEWHAAHDYGSFRQTVDFTGIDTLVFDYCTWWASELAVRMLIGGSEVWSVRPPDVSSDAHFDVAVDVSAVSGPLSLELRAEAAQAGAFFSAVFFDNLRAYGARHPASSGQIISCPIVLDEGDTWDLVHFDATLPADASLTVDVLPETGSQPIVGYADVATGADLSSIGDRTIRLRANLSRAPQGQSPVLHSWSVDSWDASRESDWSVPISSECPEHES